MFKYQHKQIISPKVILGIVIATVLGCAVSIGINFRGNNTWDIHQILAK